MGKKYWEKSKCYETNIRDIEPFFKKNGDHFYTLVNFLDSEKKVFLLLLSVCLLLLWIIYTYHACLILYIKAHVQSSKHN